MGIRILIVDDEPELGELVDVMLRKARGDVLCSRVGTAADAMRVCRTESPSLVLLDIALPDIDGLQTLRQLKADPLTQHIPVVVITAMRGQIVGEAAEAGASGTLLKPFSKAELLQAVTSALGPPR
ncbi:MAG: response regulator [Acidobacteriota bacterium]